MSKRELKNHTLRFLLVIALLSLFVSVAFAVTGNPTCASGGKDTTGQIKYTLTNDNGMKIVAIYDADNKLVTSKNFHGDKTGTIDVASSGFKFPLTVQMDDSGSTTHHSEWDDAKGASFKAKAPDRDWEIKRGGYVMLVDKFSLLAPYIGLGSTTVIGATVAVVCVKRVKRRKEN